MKAKKLVRGVGINDADYETARHEPLSVARAAGRGRRKLWVCPYYRVWQNMLSRVYFRSGSTNFQTYDDVTVCDEWLVFSNFKAWMEQQDWEGKQLDKDILIPGSREYSPETARFVSRAINMLVTDTRSRRVIDAANLPNGVALSTRGESFQAQLRREDGTKYTKSFSCPHEAHLAWAESKLEYARKVVAEENPLPEIQEAILSRYIQLIEHAREIMNPA